MEEGNNMTEKKMKICLICLKEKRIDEMDKKLNQICIDCIKRAYENKERAFMRGIPKNET